MNNANDKQRATWPFAPLTAAQIREQRAMESALRGGWLPRNDGRRVR